MRRDSFPCHLGKAKLEELVLLLLLPIRIMYGGPRQSPSVLSQASFMSSTSESVPSCWDILALTHSKVYLLFTHGPIRKEPEQMAGGSFQLYYFVFSFSIAQIFSFTLPLILSLTPPPQCVCKWGTCGRMLCIFNLRYIFLFSLKIFISSALQLK